MPERIQSEGPKKQDKTVPGRTRSSRSLRQAGSKERRMTSVHALEQQLLEQIVTHDNLTRACDRQGWRKVEQRRSSCREAREGEQGCGRCGRDYSAGFSELGT